MDFKLLGCILLIVGTSIGAGMLALPIATAQVGFVGSVILLIACWAIMTAGAFLILEVNLWLPSNSNLISMAKATMGPYGELVSWAAFFLLLYSLLCAYIAGGSDLFRNLLLMRGIDMPASVAAIIFVCVFGAVVYLGIRAIDYTNRGLMFVKLGAYVLLASLLMPSVSLEQLAMGDMTKMIGASAIMVTFTSFGFASIVPSLRIYFAGDVKKLKWAILVGSTIPLICYIIWDAAIMGVIPLEGVQSLLGIAQAQNPTSELVNTLGAFTAQGYVQYCAKLFTSVCVLTSFLGVALCLTDFLADGLKLEKSGTDNIIIHALTFLPPLGVVLFFPNIFITALEYAGIYSMVLLVLLPAWMAYSGRYRRRIAKPGFHVAGGKPLLIALMVFSFGMTVYGLVG